MLPNSGSLSFDMLQTEFGGTTPVGMHEYYAGGGFVPPGASGINGALPTVGAIALNKVRGSAASIISGARFSRFTPDITMQRSYIVAPTYMVMGNAQFPVVGSYTSADYGAHWQTRTQTAPAGLATAGYTSYQILAYQNGFVFARLSQSDERFGYNYIMRSTDGWNWLMCADVPDSGGSGATPDAICHGTIGGQDRYFIANRLGATLAAYNRALDADFSLLPTTTYGVRSAFSSDIVRFLPGAASAVAAGADGMWIASSDTGSAAHWSSPDAVTWTSRQVVDQYGSFVNGGDSTLRTLPVIFKGLHLHVFAADSLPTNMYTVTSSDGTTFLRSPAPIITDCAAQQPWIACNDNYVLLIYKTSANLWAGAVSFDGFDWTLLSSSTNLSLSSIGVISQLTYANNGTWQIKANPDIWYVPA